MLTINGTPFLRNCTMNVTIQQSRTFL